MIVSKKLHHDVSSRHIAAWSNQGSKYENNRWFKFNFLPLRTTYLKLCISDFFHTKFQLFFLKTSEHTL